MIAIVMLSGCGLKTNTFNQNGHGYVVKGEPYSGSVCQLSSLLPEGIKYDTVGIIRGNRGWFGGFAPVRQAMADEARSAGADTIVGIRMRQDVAFRGVFILRPIGEGVGLRLNDPQSFNCLAHGGQAYPEQGMTPVSRTTEPMIAPVKVGAYDECMVRVMRISDSALRLKAMAACDDVQ